MLETELWLQTGCETRVCLFVGHSGRLTRRKRQRESSAGDGTENKKILRYTIRGKKVPAPSCRNRKNIEITERQNPYFRYKRHIQDKFVCPPKNGVFSVKQTNLPRSWILKNSDDRERKKSFSVKTLSCEMF